MPDQKKDLKKDQRKAEDAAPKPREKPEPADEKTFDEHERKVIHNHEGYDIAPHEVSGFPQDYEYGRDAYEFGLNPKDDGGALD